VATRIPGKKETLLSYLARGIAMLHLDARRPGVVVPPQYTGDAHLRLNLSYRYSIPDLEITDELVQATLSFGGRSFRCLLPWASIFGITSNGTGDGQVWPEDLPVEVVHSMANRFAGQKSPAEGGPAYAGAPKRPSLSAVEGELKEPRQDGEPAAPESPTPRRHLRLVR
jgi:stringent starvation protein B